MQETGPAVYSPCPRRLDVKPFVGVVTKAARSPQLFKDPECWSGRGFKPPAKQPAALPTELTGRRLITYLKWLKKIVDFACFSIYGINKTTVQLIGSHFSPRPGLHNMSKRSPLLVTLKGGVIYTQCALVHTRVRVLYRVRILYPVRNAA